MDLMKQYGVALPQGRVASTATAAEAIATEMFQGRKGVYIMNTEGPHMTLWRHSSTLLID